MSHEHLRSKLSGVSNFTYMEIIIIIFAFHSELSKRVCQHSGWIELSNSCEFGMEGKKRKMIILPSRTGFNRDSMGLDGTTKAPNED